MRKLLWAFLFFSLYMWALSSGHDEMIVEQGKSIYRAIVTWFDDAEVDFQLQQTKSKTKKKSRRWD